MSKFKLSETVAIKDCPYEFIIKCIIATDSSGVLYVLYNYSLSEWHMNLIKEEELTEF
ncbi:MAG: hypothetical protein KA318_00135 [Nitrosomonas sp.]|nr:hypothetical protein [Nitrosomonas sp.]